MSNPTFSAGAITYNAGAALEKFTLVTLNGDGAVVPAAATGAVLGAVTEKADPKNAALPTAIAVHYGTAVVPLLVDGGDASAIKAGTAVYAAADGKVSASGTVRVGVAARNGAGDRVKVILTNLPAVGE